MAKFLREEIFSIWVLLKLTAAVPNHSTVIIPQSATLLLYDKGTLPHLLHYSVCSALCTSVLLRTTLLGISKWATTAQFSAMQLYHQSMRRRKGRTDNCILAQERMHLPAQNKMFCDSNVTTCTNFTQKKRVPGRR